MSKTTAPNEPSRAERVGAELVSSGFVPHETEPYVYQRKGEAFAAVLPNGDSVMCYSLASVKDYIEKRLAEIEANEGANK